MLQRAASNAYSWWWATHIRTNQSKWLDNRLQDMEENVKLMLGIIEEDADSFAKKAEMYYKRRPELISFVQELYKSYRALAERYDRISGELQKANNIVATVFPERAHFGMEDEGRGDSSSPSDPQSDPIIFHGFENSQSDQKKPKFKASCSKISKDNAQEEINKLQKGILVLQTEKEFIKSSFESGLAKYWDVQKLIEEMQSKVDSLKDEYSADVAIDDHEARTLMAVTALESCKNNLLDLHEKQKILFEEAKLEYQRIDNVREKLRIFRSLYDLPEVDNQEPFNEVNVLSSANLNTEEAIRNMKSKSQELKSIHDKIKQGFQKNSDASIFELAEKIDGFVNEVIGLEMEVSSQAALLQRLRLVTDELQKHLQDLEDANMTCIDRKDFNDKLSLVDEESRQIWDLKRCFQDEICKLHKHLAEACHAFNEICDVLQSPGQEHDADVAGPKSNQEENAPHSQEAQDPERKYKKQDQSGMPKEEQKTQLEESHKDQGFNVNGSQQGEGAENEELPLPNWQQLFLNGLEDKEKILLAEYTSVLRNYKETKRKLSEAEKKSQEYLLEASSQIEDLKNAIVIKDEEINALRENLNFLESCWNENLDVEMPESEYPGNCIIESTVHEKKSSWCSALLNEISDMAKPEVLKETHLETVAASDRIAEDIAVESTPLDLNKKESEEKGGEVPLFEDIIEIQTEEHHDVPVAAIEEKIRQDIDKLLEENLEFWSRFTSALQQIQNYQMEVEDMQSETEKLKSNKKTESSISATGDPSNEPESASAHKQLNEMRTKLSVWFEETALLKDELEGKLSSLWNIKEEISREDQLTAYQATKFQGEVLSMVQENKNVADQLQAGFVCVEGLQAEVTKMLMQLGTNTKHPELKNQNHHNFKNTPSKTRVPLRSFLFGSRTRKPSIFPCMNPAIQRNYSNLAGGVAP